MGKRKHSESAAAVAKDFPVSNDPFPTTHNYSPALRTFLHGRVPERGLWNRGQIVKALWQHIKANGLQHPLNRRRLILDEALGSLFRCPVDMFSMNKQLSEHISKVESKDTSLRIEYHKGGRSFMVRGNTYNAREILKGLRGLWNRGLQAWIFPLSDDRMEEVRNSLVVGGFSVTMPTKKDLLAPPTTPAATTEENLSLSPISPAAAAAPAASPSTGGISCEVIPALETVKRRFQLAERRGEVIDID